MAGGATTRSLRPFPVALPLLAPPLLSLPPSLPPSLVHIPPRLRSAPLGWGVPPLHQPHHSSTLLFSSLSSGVGGWWNGVGVGARSLQPLREGLYKENCKNRLHSTLYLSTDICINATFPKADVESLPGNLNLRLGGGASSVWSGRN